MKKADNTEPAFSPWTKEHFAEYLAKSEGISYEEAMIAIDRCIENGKIPTLRSGKH